MQIDNEDIFFSDEVNETTEAIRKFTIDDHRDKDIIIEDMLVGNNE